MPIPMPSSPFRISDADRLLLIRLGAVGDVLRTLPALHLIRTAFPAVHVAWVAEEVSLELLAGHPEIDELIPFPRRRLISMARRPSRLAAALYELGRDLRGRRFTVAVDFQGSLKSGMIALLSGAPRRVGFAPGHCREMSFLFTNHWVRPRSRWLNRVERNLLLSEALGATGDDVIMLLPETTQEGRRAEETARQLAPGGEPLVLLAPGTSRRQAYKRWPLVRYSRLAARLASELGVVPAVTWGPGEEEMARAVVRDSDGAARLAPPLGLRSLAALLRRAALFVGADTGPMHLAWGVGCPVIAIFGPTDPRLNGPLGRGHAVLRGGSSAAAVSADEAFGAARAVLGRAPRTPRIETKWSRATLFTAAAGPPP
ncbi:MAG: glycosyltransferase family 9 protein [Acidobacteriota bacterium]